MQLKVSVSLILTIVLWSIISPTSMGAVFNEALRIITTNFGWLYLWTVLGLVVVAATLAFSRFGSLKLGDDDEEPEFSVVSWFAMLFAAGMGIGLVFWGVAEPVSHYITPPPGITAETPEAANAAMRYSFFHWGLHPWAVYSIVALSLAYFQYRRGRPALVSESTGSLPWRPVKSMSGMFNGLAVVATAFGVAASLGMGALQINSGLHELISLPVGKASQVGIIVVTTALFITSAVSGVERGIKILSYTNLVIAALLTLAVTIVGPTVAIIDTFTTTLGSYISNFVPMSLKMTPFRESTWVGGWTVFYWAWWISWSPAVGSFIARVSRGRTVRQFIIGTVLAPALVSFIWFSVFGGAALYMEIWQGVPVAEAVKSDVTTAILTMFSAMPGGFLMSIAATLVITIFFVTSGDSATLVLGIMSTNGNPNPSSKIKILWGCLIAGIAISLLLAGGLEAVQTATIVFALPFTFVIVLMTIAVWRAMDEDWNKMQREERELKQKMRQLIAENKK